MASFFEFIPPFTFIKPQRIVRPTDDVYGAAWILKPNSALAYIPGGKRMGLSVIGGELFTVEEPFEFILSDDKKTGGKDGLVGRITIDAKFRGLPQTPQKFGNSTWDQSLRYNFTGKPLTVARFWRQDDNHTLEAAMRLSQEGGLADLIVSKFLHLSSQRLPSENYLIMQQ